MLTEIQEIIDRHPKHFSRLISKNDEMIQWVNDHKTVATGSLSEQIYSAIHNSNPICEHGNHRKFKSIKTGYGFCGPNSSCLCSKEHSAITVSLAKKNYSPDQHRIINEKRAKTNLEKTGFEFNSQRPEIKAILSKPKIPINAYNLLNDRDWLDDQYNVQKKTLVDIGQQLGVYYSTMASYCAKFDFKIRKHSNYSLIELQVLDYIRSLGIEAIHSDWSILDKKEIDILIPSANLAIEINGLYWHSNTAEVEDRTQHLEKTIEANLKGIDLLHITDWQWINKQDIVKNLIKAKLKLTKRIFARKCRLSEISNREARLFFEKYHMQGYVPANKTLALIYDDEIVMAASFGKSRYSKSANIELLRLCTIQDNTVVGGGSRLISHASNLFGEPIISYCDRDRSAGLAYKKMGFDLVRETGPGYFWTDGVDCFSRSKTQKKNLKKWLPSFDPDLSESENMFAAGYRRYWNCGNLVFLKTSK